MITMVEKNSILIKYYREGKNISEISRLLKLSRKTVRKYIVFHESQNNDKTLSEKLEKGLTCKPKYDSSHRVKRRLIKEIEEEIKYCLDNNQKRRNQGLYKQLMKKIDIYEYLKSKGYEVGYTTVCNYIREFESAGKESFIKQIYEPGKTVEFDWGEVKLKIKGKLQKFNLAVFTAAYSNYRWAKLFHRQDTLAFSQSHIDFFSHTQGVYKELVYDNMRVAVRKFIGPTEKEPTEALLELSSYYKFGFRFCNVRRGNEKGHVEKSVEHIRRKSFSLKIDFESVEQANQHLLNSCEKINNTGQKLKENQTANELFSEEKSHLYATSIPYKCFKEELCKVDKYSTITLYGNRYSVPDFLVGKLLDVKIFAEKIVVYSSNKQECKHIRSYGLHTWTIDLKHYLDTLILKPGALHGSLGFNQLHDKVKHVYDEYFLGNSKEFIELLDYCSKGDIEFLELNRAIKKLKTITPISISKDKILAIIAKDREPTTTESEDSETKRCSESLLSNLSSCINN